MSLLISASLGHRLCLNNAVMPEKAAFFYPQSLFLTISGENSGLALPVCVEAGDLNGGQYGRGGEVFLNG